MQFSESWLRSVVQTSLNTDDLAEKLTMAGLEVEDLEPVAPDFSGVVIGEVLTKAKHPDADRLSVCTVKVDEGEPRQIVCGAPNVEVGVKVPCALPGAVLPGNFKIKPTKMRGVESGGMLCAAKELGISADSAGLYLLPADAPVGQNIREYLNLDEKVFTLKMTPNRADCLSIYGVAREVAALADGTLKTYDFSPVATPISDSLKVHNEAKDLCGRFAGRVIKGVNNNTQTPDWMVQRLEQAGQRSLNPLVDISNYVMLELGRPTHVFDLAKLQGDLVVRWANQGEKLELLNEQTVELAPHFGVIADNTGAQALAGVMGGNHTAVSEQTTDVFVEAAFWYPDAIVGRARELNFSSEASHRFERGVDPSNLVEHLEWMTHLILDICGGQAAPIEDQQFDLPKPKAVSMRHARCEMVIGMSFSQAQIEKVFSSLGFECVTTQTDDGLTYQVVAPTYRFDIEIEEDLIEEVIRVVGYEALPLRAPMGKLKMLPNNESQLGRNQVRHQIASLGYQEVVSYSFTPDQWEKDFTDNSAPVELINPIASHLSVMRSSMIGSLLGVLKHNLGHRVDRLRVFELARTFLSNDQAQESALSVQGFEQTWKVAGLAFGLAAQLQWDGANRQVDFFDVKGDIEQLLEGRRLQFQPVEHAALHPGRSAEVFEKGKSLGFIGELHPKWLKPYDLPGAPVLFELNLEPLLARKLSHYKEVSKQPVVIRDLAFVVDNSIEAEKLKKAIQATQKDKQGWLKSVILFDEFVPKEEGKGLNLNEKSLAYRLRFQAQDRSLTDEDLEPIVASMIELAVQNCQARLR